MLESCLWILKTDSFLTNVDNYKPIITTVESSICNFSGFVGPSLINNHDICHFLLFSCFYLIYAIFGEHAVCRISSQDIFLYEIICVKEIFENIFCLKEIFDLGSIDKGCSYVTGGGGSKKAYKCRQREGVLN